MTHLRAAGPKRTGRVGALYETWQLYDRRAKHHLGSRKHGRIDAPLFGPTSHNESEIFQMEVSYKNCVWDGGKQETSCMEAIGVQVKKRCCTACSLGEVGSVAVTQHRVGTNVPRLQVEAAML